MKKVLTIVFVTLSILMILDSLNAGHAIFMFFLAGIIPGTQIAIDASTMLMMFAMLMGFTISRLTANRVLGLLKKLPELKQA